MIVTVVIPAYNQARYLPAALECVLAQRGVDLDVVVVDDGSTDETPQVLRPYEGRVRTLRQDNAGVSAARNLGIAALRGDAVLFLDADDLLGGNALASQAAFLQAHPEADMAVCRNGIFGACDGQGMPEVFDEWPLFSGDYDVHVCHFNIAPIHAFLCRRKVVEAVGGFDASLVGCEDHDFWLRALHLGFTARRNPEPLVYYRKHEASATTDAHRLYRHDGLLQLRIAELLDRDAGFPRKRCEGLLANAAGSALTALRIHEREPDLARALLDIAVRRLDQAQDTGSAAGSDLTSWFLHRLLSFAAGERPAPLDPGGRLKAALAGVLARAPGLAPGYRRESDPAAKALALAAKMY
ncbi:MAG: glycosyltransferase [Acidobacteriota bacterium]